mgnify:CR=1 FL=1
MLNFLLTKEKAFDFLSKIFSIITPRPIEMFSVEMFPVKMFPVKMFPVKMFPKSCMCKKSRGAD